MIFEIKRFVAYSLGLVIAVGASTAAVSTGARAETVKTIVATVNDDVISSHDVEQRVKLAMMAANGQIPSEMVPRIRAQVLRTLVDEKLRLQEAKRLDVPATDADVRREIETLAQENGQTYDQFKSGLASKGVKLRTIEDQIRADMVWSMLVRGRYGRNVTVTDIDVDYAFERAVTEADKPSYLVSEIFLDIPSAEQEGEVFKDAKQLVAQIRKGAPFQTMAQQFSQSISAASGGDLGWVTAQDVDPEVAKAISSLSSGQLSQPIRTREGYTVLLVRQVRVPGRGDPMQSKITLRQVFFGFGGQPSQEMANRLMQSAVAARGQLSGCSNLEQVAAKYENAVAVDSEHFVVKDLPDALQQLVINLGAGQAATPVPSNRGVHIFVVCSRKDQKVEIVKPTREQVEQRLYSQQLNMYAKRYIRDLRADAIIEYRQF